ncbi:AbrB/MazE/SpoVT family DNA-binding domain-containing protein, partial [Marinobacterium weihaiense]
SDCCPGMLNWSGLQKKWRSTVKGKWVVLTAVTFDGEGPNDDYLPDREQPDVQKRKRRNK